MLKPNQRPMRIYNTRCGRGCGHKFAVGEQVLGSRTNGDVCKSCMTAEDLMVRPVEPDTHEDEIRDALAGHP